MSLDRILYFESGVYQQVDLITLYSPGTDITILSTIPAWFVNNTMSGYSSSWDIAPPVDGTFNYNVEILYQGVRQTYLLTIIVRDKFDDVDNCCEKTNIVWLNRHGGYSNFMFTQRINFDVEMDKPITFVSDDVIKYSQRDRIYDSVTLFVTGLSNNQIDYLSTSRYAIQAWEFNEDTYVFTPILIESGNFAKRNTKDRLNKTSITYKYAKALNVQRQ